MYINNCRCSKYINIPEEYPINYTPSSIKIKLPESSNKDYRDLKCKIITEVFDVILLLECGITPSLEIIMEEMSLIEADKYEEL